MYNKENLGDFIMAKKGQTLSAEVIEKMQKARFNKVVSKYNWIIIEPYLDVEIKNGSQKRKNKYITFREFKKNTKDGLSIKNMVDSGVSRKVLQFFSNFCQGKINLTKDQFLEDYNEGKSLDEICEGRGVTREDITYLRQLYGIKRKGATFIKRKKTEVLLTSRQKEILYGSLMGDAKRQHSKSFASAGFGHSQKQESYLRWKYIEFENLCTDNSLKFYPSNDDREEFKGHEGTWRFYTSANTDIETIIKQFYESNNKQITMELLNHLTPLSIAIWFMDDGYVDKSKYGISNLIFCTDSFTKKSCENIVEWFLSRYNIKAHLRERRIRSDGEMSYRVVIKAESRDEFIKLVEPYIISSMRYKIGGR